MVFSAVFDVIAKRGWPNSLVPNVVSALNIFGNLRNRILASFRTQRIPITSVSESDSLKALLLDFKCALRLLLSDGVVGCVTRDNNGWEIDPGKEDGEIVVRRMIAIVTSARFGHIHIAGLACERYADFLLNEFDDKHEADYQIDKAAQFYLDWGAYAVVERLKGIAIARSMRSQRSSRSLRVTAK